MFDRYVDGARRTSWRRGPWIIGSLFAHGLVGGFLFACTLLEVDEIRPPALGIVLLSAPPPPPPLPPALGRKSVVEPTTPREKKPRVHKPVVQPAEVQPAPAPEARPEPEAKTDAPAEVEEEDEGDPDGVVGGAEEGGVKGGNLAGVHGGQLGAPTPAPPAPAVPAPAAPPKVVASFVFDRERLHFPDPHLPEAFKQSHPNQTVRGLYKICVGTSGKIVKMSTVSSISGVDGIIIGQVQDSWLYKPQPVEVCTLRNFEFHIIN